MVIDCFDCRNRECFIKQCSKDWISMISDQKFQMIFKTGHHIFREGDIVNGVYFIQEGKVKVTSTTLKGDEHIVRLAGNGHLIGHRGYGHEKYPISAIAMEESRICFVDNDLLYQAYMNNPEFTYKSMLFYSKELRKSEQGKQFLAQMTMEEKVIFALLYIIETFGTYEKDHSIPQCISRKDISAIAGTNVEQVSRALSVLKERKLIETDKRKIIIKNPPALRELISFYIREKELI